MKYNNGRIRKLSFRCFKRLLILKVFQTDTSYCQLYVFIYYGLKFVKVCDIGVPYRIEGTLKGKRYIKGKAVDIGVEPLCVKLY